MTGVRLLNEFSGDMLQRIAGFYVSAKWITPEDDTSFLLPALQGSFLVAGAFDGDKIIGCARVISDGCSDAYIQDVVVDPEYRRQGVGESLISLLLEQLHERNIDWIGLVGEPGTEKFYQSINWRKKDGFVLWQPDKE